MHLIFLYWSPIPYNLEESVLRLLSSLVRFLTLELFYNVPVIIYILMIIFNRLSHNCIVFLDSSTVTLLNFLISDVKP